MLLENLELKEEENKKEENLSNFIFYHLPNEMSVTVGNFFRRILLSFIKGIALVGIELYDVEGLKRNRISSLKGIVETTPYLIANCKNIVCEFKLDDKEVKSDSFFFLETEIINSGNEEYILRAGKLESLNLNVKDPNIYLATISPKDGSQNSELKMKLYFRYDYGYKTAKEQKKYFSELLNKDDIIVLDTDYSPNILVNFKERVAVIDQERQEKNLELTIKTNGTISPHESFIETFEIIENISKQCKKKLIN